MQIGNSFLQKDRKCHDKKDLTLFRKKCKSVNLYESMSAILDKENYSIHIKDMLMMTNAVFRQFGR